MPLLNPLHCLLHSLFVYSAILFVIEPYSGHSLPGWLGGGAFSPVSTSSITFPLAGKVYSYASFEPITLLTT